VDRRARKRQGTSGWSRSTSTPSFYEKGHIEGAVGWNWRKDLQTSSTATSPARKPSRTLLGKSGITADTTIVLYGDNNNWFAAYAYWALKYYGHDKVSAR